MGGSDAAANDYRQRDGQGLMFMNHMQAGVPELSPQSISDLLCTIILLCHAEHPDGRPFWAYLCIRPSMAKAFVEARDSGAFDLEDFGTIIEWGDGEEVPADMQARMARDYGVRNDYEAQLAKAVEMIKSKYSP